jgi:hypothetical protein
MDKLDDVSGSRSRSRSSKISLDHIPRLSSFRKSTLDYNQTDAKNQQEKNKRA